MRLRRSWNVELSNARKRPDPMNVVRRLTRALGLSVLLAVFVWTGSTASSQAAGYWTCTGGAWSGWQSTTRNTTKIMRITFGNTAHTARVRERRGKMGTGRSFSEAHLHHANARWRTALRRP